MDAAAHFPEECRYVVESLSVIYKNDAEAHEKNLSPEARLYFHQTHSRPTMEQLHVWLQRQIEDRLVEPNSGLGEAIAYLLKYWAKMTLFLRNAGAPLDNNLCERALKRACRKDTIYPDSDDATNPPGDGADGIYDRMELKYNRQGEVTERKDLNGTVYCTF
ncbi:MAG: transposase [Pirellulales bacterium]|nr:transposase [Pirellulales bacterium]